MRFMRVGSVGGEAGSGADGGLWRYPLPCSISYQPRHDRNHTKSWPPSLPARFRLAPVVVLWPVAVGGWVPLLLIHREGILEQEEHVRRLSFAEIGATDDVNFIPTSLAAASSRPSHQAGTIYAGPADAQAVQIAASAGIG